MADFNVNVTADPFTGDSGTGGTQGQVPAPAAGDTAAGKYLSANGSFENPLTTLGTAAFSNTGDFDAAGAAATAQAAAISAAATDATTKANAAAAASQPLDSDLTAIAALTTTTYGRAFLALADAAAARTATGAAPQTTVDALKVEVFSGVVKYAANATYTIDTSAAFGYTVNTLIIESDSGTVTAALKIGATAITGISAVSVSSTAATGTATAANVVSTGNRLILVMSSNADARNVKYTIKYTRS